MKKLFIYLALFALINPIFAQEKVFGIGLSHTGTRSLTEALRILNLSIVHFPRDARTLHDLLRDDGKLKILADVDGITDITVVPYYKQLHQMFPEAKFILTIREEESWLRGCEKHWELYPIDKINPSRRAERRNQIQRALRNKVYGTLEFDREQFSHVYEKHVRDVLDYFGDHSGSLLVMNICDGEGWEALCPFLNKPIPNVSFPHVSSLRR